MVVLSSCGSVCMSMECKFFSSTGRKSIYVDGYAVPPAFFERLAGGGYTSPSFIYQTFFVEARQDATIIIEQSGGSTFMLFSNEERTFSFLNLYLFAMH